MTGGGHARRWGLAALLAGLLSACMAAAAPPPTPDPSAIIVGMVTAPITMSGLGRPYLMIDTHDGPSVVGVRTTTPIWLHTIGQLQPLAPAVIAVGDRVTIRVDGIILESSPSQLTAAEIVVVR